MNGALGASVWAQYNGTINGTGNNQMSGSSQNVNQGQYYDASGNIGNDGISAYLYDGEGRICAVQQQIPGIGSAMTGYIYDADGNRVAKGTISAWSCDTTQNGFSPQSAYVLGPGGEQLTEMSYAGGVWQWAHTNVYAPGLSATYDNDLSGKTAGPLYFHLTDWLGTRRQQTDYAGNPMLNFAGLPFGDGLTTIPVSNTDAADATEHHFTGKERDSESGNDYFGARYYASSMGRFLSPDPSQLYFADPTNPQSLNLYSYAYNNPLSNIDPTGLDACAYDNGDGTSAIVNAADGGAVNCPGNGFYITTNQQVTGVGYNSNGDLAVAGTADGSLINPDGSAYNPSQSITVNGDDGSSSYIGLPPISSGTQVISTQPTAMYSPQGYSRADVCAASALLHKGAATGLDAVGIIPGEGNVLKAAQAGAGVVSAGMAVAGPGNKTITKDVALSGSGLGLTAVDTTKVFEKGSQAAKLVPFLGNGLSAFATYSDLQEMKEYYDACMRGEN